MNERETRITVPLLARVEGEGALTLRLRDGRIDTLELRIYEPPRLFETFLEGRDWHEVPDMVARVCGICPVAYQMSAVHALEQAFGVDPGTRVRALRRLFYCGEWIQSHSLHIHLLAAPDFLGFDSAPAMARRYPEEVRRGLRLQGIGNDIIRLLGARSVHPVGARVGGFHRLPRPDERQVLRERLAQALEDAGALVRWTAGLELPADDQVFTSVALRHPDEYPMNEGRIVSSDGLGIDRGEYEAHFREFQVPWSTALHSLLHERPYLVGPLARLNLNHDRLPEPVQALLRETGIALPSRNMFHSIVARAVEIHYALLEAARLLDSEDGTAGAPGLDSAAPKHRADCCGTATRPTPGDASSRRGSCRRPARIRRGSRRTCARRWKPMVSRDRRRSCGSAPRPSSGTTIRAFPAPRISSGCGLPRRPLLWRTQEKKPKKTANSRVAVTRLASMPGKP
jgi:sulfhydrogenase subunit alpha